MSYIVAFIKFSESGNDYPVECYRTDIEVGDHVFVDLPQKPFQRATVARLAYLNWDCKGQIACKASEAAQDADGFLFIPNGVPRFVGLTCSRQAISLLREQGWIPQKSSIKTYREILTYSNSLETAHILFRKNGVDFQIVPGRPVDRPKPYSLLQVSLSDTHGKLVRHYLANSPRNLYEEAAHFAGAFASDEANYEKFFQSMGSSSGKSDAFKERKKQTGSHESDDAREMSLREALSDCADSEGRIYLCDGVYI